MTDQATPPPSTYPEAQAHRSRWFGLVWAIPLAALIIVAYLGIQSIAERGITIVVTFNDVTGAKVDDTKVMYDGIEAGHVSKIDINPDHRRVDLTLRMDPRVKPILNTNTKFWLVGANPDLSDLSSVKAAIAGLTIGVAPGYGGKPTREFVGLDRPPAVTPGTPGTNYVLTCDHLGNVKAGTSLFYRGQEIGKVTEVQLQNNVFNINAFVFAPYDHYIRPGAQFWVSSPLKLGFNDNGLSASVEHPGAILDGGIEVDRRDDAPDVPQSAAGTHFALYAYQGEAKAAAAGPQIPYAIMFVGAAGGIDPGTPVRLLGFRVGAIKSVELMFDKKTGQPYSAVSTVLYPTRLGVSAPQNPDDLNAWREATDVVIKRLLAQGYRAQLTQSPPVVGSLLVTLSQVPNAAPATLGTGTPELIPSAATAAGLEELTGQLSQILAKVNAIPFDAIGKNVHDITSKVDQLVSSPEVADSLKHLDSTLAQADQMMKQASPQVGPLIKKLNQAADDISGTAAAARGMLNGDDGKQDASLPAAIEQLTDAARSIRTLADYLGRHPEALIRGKGKDQ
jgi:paraquat-inducible protein B